MKFLTALLTRFSRKAEAPDAFELRLKSITQPQPRKRQAHTVAPPVLFRREMHHA